MKFTTIASVLLPMASAAMYSKEEYTSGAVMAKMMEVKEVFGHFPISACKYLLTDQVCVGIPQGSWPLRQQEVERLAQAQGQQGLHTL